MIYINKQQIIKIHCRIIKEFGGIDGIRDESMLDSALANPLQTFAGNDLYPDITEKIVKLGYSIIKNHPFLDGNKRTGLHSMLILFSLNGFKFQCSHETLTNTIMNVADGSFSFQEFIYQLKKFFQSQLNGIFLCAKNCSINVVFF